MLWLVPQLCVCTRMHYNRIVYADINECSHNETSNCDQLCINTDGSFVCACEEGYQLREGTNQCEGNLMQIYLIRENIYALFTLRY